MATKRGKTKKVTRGHVAGYPESPVAGVGYGDTGGKYGGFTGTAEEKKKRNAMLKAAGLKSRIK